ncbi:MAG: hypothetical protein E6J85_12065 [Deltaproteobacteria bacterium]|nr:MAG: hypothetical protein E6J85_12065 [Deltaproteobacteria bacterium]
MEPIQIGNSREPVPAPGAQLDVLVRFLVGKMAGIGTRRRLDRAGQRHHVARVEADTKKLVPRPEGDVAESGGAVVAHPGRIEVVLEDEVRHLDLEHERTERRVLGAKEQAILALRFRLPARARLLGEVAILDGEAKAARARTVESQRARGRITTTDGAGESR